MRLLAGITHAIVDVPSKKDSIESGVAADVQLCYGPGDDTSICHIQYVRSQTGDLVWRVPHVFVTEHGVVKGKPVFRGQLLEQLCQVAARALDRIKNDYGRPQFGAQYRVADNKAVLVQEQAA